MANRKARLDPRVLTISDLAKEASLRLPKHYDEYYNHGAGDMISLYDNEAAFNRYKLRPRILRNVDGNDMTTTMFGTKVSAPFGFAPTAAHKIAHQDGESGTSRAAARHGLAMCLSSWSTTGLEDVIKQGQGNPYAMQISFLRDISTTQRIIERAERAGYRAIFVSVDLPVLGNRLNEARNNFVFPKYLGLPNLDYETQADDRGLVACDSLDYDPTIIWERTIPWLREHTKMEIWLKGVFASEDVQLAIDHGLDGVIISNHGGRQLDGVPATLDALRECAPTAKGKIKIAMDGGIRRGSDIFKAVALGADFCWVGRPAIWGLAYNGEAGVDLAIQILMDEFRQTMMLTGCRTIQDIQQSHLAVLRNDGLLAKL